MERLADLRWADHFTDVEPPKNAPKDGKAFNNQKNRALFTGDAAVIAVLQTLTDAWPASLDIDSLTTRARPSLPKEDSTDDAAARKAVLSALQTLFRGNMLRYTLEPSPYDAIAAERVGTDSDTVNSVAAGAGSDAPALIPGAMHLYQQRQEPSFGIGMFNLWHDTANTRLKETEAFLLPHINGSNSHKQLTTLLRDAWHHGTVPGTDGKSLKGQRNLDARADKVVRNVLALLKRQGLVW